MLRGQTLDVAEKRDLMWRRKHIWRIFCQASCLFPSQMQKNNSERLLTAMSNSILIHLNNTAIDHLNCGEVYKAQRILTQAFYGSIRQSHRQHILEPSIEKMGFEYMLQDCFRPLQRCFPRSNSFASSDPHLFLSLNFVRIETSHLSLECVDRFCTCALSWALGYKYVNLCASLSQCVILVTMSYTPLFCDVTALQSYTLWSGSNEVWKLEAFLSWKGQVEYWCR